MMTEIDETDLRVDVYSWGFNDLAVVITHLPTGTVAKSDGLKSQRLNYNEALRQLKERLEVAK